MERLYELHHAEAYDVVVVDTPPTRSALELLDAPERLLRFLGHRVVRALHRARRASRCVRRRRRPRRSCAASRRSSAASWSRTPSRSSRRSPACRRASPSAPATSRRCSSRRSTAYVLVTDADRRRPRGGVVVHPAPRRRAASTPCAAVVNRCHPSLPRRRTPPRCPPPTASRGDQLATARRPRARGAPRRRDARGASRRCFGGSAVSRVALSPAPASELDGLARRRPTARRRGAAPRVAWRCAGASGTLARDGPRARGERPPVAAPLDPCDPRGSRARGPRGRRPAPRRCASPSTRRSTSRSSTCRSARWARSRSARSCATSSPTATREHTTVLLLLDRRPDVFLARRAGAEGFCVKPLEPVEAPPRGADAARRRRPSRTTHGGP